MAAHPFLEHNGVLAFAHRGDHSAGPENTLVAFEGALRLGFRYLETDVHVTRDNVLLAFHDASLDRVTDQRGTIAKLDYDQVRCARVGGREPVPLLEDLLGAFPSARINIDPKSDAVVGPLIDVIRRTRAEARVCIGSFNGNRLNGCDKHCLVSAPRWHGLSLLGRGLPALDGRGAAVAPPARRCRCGGTVS